METSEEGREEERVCAKDGVSSSGLGVLLVAPCEVLFDGSYDDCLEAFSVMFGFYPE